MKKSLGNSISDLRKQKRMTQDELAEKMSVSSQAVSKWENDLSIPDLPTLIQLSEYFHISLDDLVKERDDTVRYVPMKERKQINDMFLRVNVESVQGDIVKVNLPLAIVKMAAEMSIDIPQFNGKDILGGLDLEQLMNMIEAGAIGKLVEVKSVDGDIVEVYVE